MPDNLKVGIFGAGAVGSYIGGKLATEGLEVVLFGRARAMADLEASGLFLQDMNRPSVKVATGKLALRSEASALANCGVVLCCVKSAQTAEAASILAGVLPPGAIVVSMQNGVGNADELRKGLTRGPSVLGGIVGFNVVSLPGGTFQRATTGALVIEASADPRITELARGLTAGKLEVELTRDIRAVQWSKLIMNLNNAIGALTDAPTRELIFGKGYRRILAAVMAESLTVLRAAKIRPARLGPLPPRLFPLMLRLPTPLLRIVAGAQLKIDPEARSSMWQDVSRGRLTEVDYLNGEIVRLAASCGARAPFNQRIVELIHDVEKKGEGSPKLSADALWEQLTSASA